MARQRYTKSLTLLLPVGVFILSIFIIVLYWAILPETFRINENADYIIFHEPVARNILAGRGLILPTGTIAVRHPLGYPVILAGIFGLSNLLDIPESTALLTFILLCMGLTSVFIFLLAQNIWGTLPALISSLTWMTYPLALWLMKQPNSEIPFLVFFYGSFYLFWYALLRKKFAWYIYFISGILIGLAMLIRPIAIGIGLVMGVILWLVGRQISVRLRLFLITMLLLGNFVAVFPWQAWVYFRTGRVVLLSTVGVPAIRDGLTFAVTPKSWRKGVKVPHDVAVLMKDIRTHYGELQCFRDITLFLAKKLRKHPLTVTKLFFIKAARSWYGTDSRRFETSILLIQAIYLIFILWSTIAVWRQRGFARQLAVSIWLVVLYFWGMATLALSIVRYMVPVMGLLFVLIPGLFFKPYVFKNKAILK